MTTAGASGRPQMDAHNLAPAKRATTGASQKLQTDAQKFAPVKHKFSTHKRLEKNQH